MKIILFSRPRTAHVPEELRQIFAAVEECGFDYAVNDEFAATLETLIGLHIPASRRYGRDVGRQPAGSVLVCYGGDGTLLEGVRRLGGREIPVVGINSGHLGFLTIAPRDGFRRIFEAIRAGELKTEPRTMIEVSGLGRRNRPALAVNEVSVERQGPGMISVDTYVDGLLGHRPRRRDHRFDPHGLDGLFAQRGRPGGRTPVRLPDYRPRCAPQPDHAACGGARRQHDHPDHPRPAGRCQCHARQRNAPNPRRFDPHGTPLFAQVFSRRAAQYILLRHVTE